MIVPVIFALLPKTQNTYTRLFRLLQNKIPNFSPKLFKIDFEVAAINAIKEIFPTAKVTGCFFHYSQAVWKKAKNLGFTETEAQKRFIGLCVALAHLPSECIPEAWIYLMHNSLEVAISTPFMDYMSNQ